MKFTTPALPILHWTTSSSPRPGVKIHLVRINDVGTIILWSKLRSENLCMVGPAGPLSVPENPFLYCHLHTSWEKYSPTPALTQVWAMDAFLDSVNHSWDRLQYLRLLWSIWNHGWGDTLATSCGCSERAHGPRSSLMGSLQGFLPVRGYPCLKIRKHD